MYGLSFNSKHSFNDFGLSIYTKNRPILAEPKIVTEDIEGNDGEYDFSEVNPDNRTKYKSKIHEIEFTLKESDLVSLRNKAHKIAEWLACGEKQLVYDDEPTVFYLGKVVNKLDLENQARTVKRFTVQFRCKPHAYSINQSNTTRTVIGNTSFLIENIGTNVKPIIRVDGSCDNISFNLNGKTLTYNAPVTSSQMLEIDCENMEALKGSLNVTKNTTGDFLELINGDNTIQVTGTNLNCAISVVFRQKFL